MNPDLARIAQAIGECRASLQFCEGLRHDNFQVWHIERHEPVFVGTRADCLAYIDARCAEAAVRAMREPSLEMLWFGHEAARQARTSGASGMTIDAQMRAECAREAAAFTAMCDAILGDTQP